jgi:DNA-directed RNA polymerase specialized sigma24 family protein
MHAHPHESAVGPQDIDAALQYALTQIDRRCFSDRLRERAYDACVDAILRAVNTHNPHTGTFAAYAAAFADQAIRSVVTKPLPHRDRTQALPASEDLHPPARCTVQRSTPFGELPEELRIVCSLYHLHGFTFAEVSLLTGLAPSTLHARLQTAAALLLA